MLNKYNKPQDMKQRDNDLIRRFVEEGDLDACATLIGHYEYFLRKQARAMHAQYNNIDYEELLSAAKTGFVLSLYKFDPLKGLSIATYAQHWMKAEMGDHIFKNFSPVKLPSDPDSKSTFFKRRAITRMIENSSDLPLKERFQKAAKHFNVSTKAIERVLSITNAKALQLDASNPYMDDGATYGEIFADAAASPEDIVADANEKEVRRAYLQEALQILNPRELDIFTRRKLQDEPSTLDELGAEYNLSKERVRQIEVRAFEKVQAFITGVPTPAKKNRRTPEPA